MGSKKAEKPATSAPIVPPECSPSGGSS